MSFLSALCSYLVVFIVFAVVIAVAVALGIFFRIRKNRSGARNTFQKKESDQ